MAKTTEDNPYLITKLYIYSLSYIFCLQMTLHYYLETQDKTTMWDKGNSSVGKVFAAQAGGPEFRSLEPMKKPGIAMYICIPRADGRG